MIVKRVVQIGQLCTAAYGLVMALWATARATPLGASALVELFSNLMPLLLLPAPLCLPFALLRGPRLARVLAATPALLLAAQFAFLAMPRSQPATSGKTLRVASYNIYSRSLGIAEVIGIIEQIDADVIALQEVGQIAAAAFDAQLATRYPYRAMHPHPGSDTIGQAVLSKYPISSDEYWERPLGQQRVSIRVDSLVIGLYNAHPGVPFGGDGRIPFDGAARDATIREIVTRASLESGPVIVAGDFNMTPESVMHAEISRQLNDTWRAVGDGPGHTWPAVWDRPNYPMDGGMLRFLRTRVVRIDYLWHNPGLTPIRMQVWPDGAGSDHRPVVAVYGLGS